MELDADTTVGVVGAGTMGTRIAQLAATVGHNVLLADASSSVLDRARESIRSSMDRGAKRGRLTEEAADAAFARIRTVSGSGREALEHFASCGLVIEAIAEDEAAKKDLFTDLETVVAPDAVLATNTSSLSITALASACRHRERFVGIHFFNPAHVMPLVEIVRGLTTDPGVATGARRLMSEWGKSPVVASDTPGFIVNRIARPFYGEALRIAEEGIADYATIDWAMREVGGFRMGPFELMDFVGNDVNYAVTRFVYEGLYHDPRYRPSLTQRRLVEAGFLGRKAGRGFYEYCEGAEVPEPVQDRGRAERIVERIVVMLINEAVEALRLDVATASDIELAMTKGVGYPRGLLAWGEAMGWPTVLRNLITLQQDYGEDRYRPSPLLRRLAVGEASVETSAEASVETSAEASAGKP